MSGSQTPKEEIAERVAEAAPNLTVATQLVALDHHDDLMADARQRTDDAHRMGAKVLGMEDCLPKKAEGEEMKKTFILTGDVMGDEACRALGRLEGNQPVRPSTPPAPVKPSLAAKVAPYLLGAALGAGGGLAAYALGAGWGSSKPEQPPAATDTDTTRRIEVEVWRPGE
jgi:hypothetical protein